MAAVAAAVIATTQPCLRTFSTRCTSGTAKPSRTRHRQQKPRWRRLWQSPTEWLHVCGTLSVCWAMLASPNPATLMHPCSRLLLLEEEEALGLALVLVQQGEGQVLEASDPEHHHELQLVPVRLQGVLLLAPEASVLGDSAFVKQHVQFDIYQSLHVFDFSFFPFENSENVNYPEQFCGERLCGLAACRSVCLSRCCLLTSRFTVQSTQPREGLVFLHTIQQTQPWDVLFAVCSAGGVWLDVCVLFACLSPSYLWHAHVCDCVVIACVCVSRYACVLSLSFVAQPSVRVPRALCSR